MDYSTNSFVELIFHNMDSRFLSDSLACPYVRKGNLLLFWTAHTPYSITRSFLWFTHTLTHTHTQIYLYVCVYVCVCVCVLQGGTGWRSWLRHCATSRKVAGSIPDGVFGIFHWHNPSGRTMALELTQPLTEMSTRNISWGYRRLVPRADNLTTFTYQF